MMTPGSKGLIMCFEYSTFGVNMSWSGRVTENVGVDMSAEGIAF